MAVSFTINGQAIQAKDGQTILQAAGEHGFHIPTLCYHKDLTPTGNCRMCVVEVEGQRFLQASCVTTVMNNMVVRTSSERVLRSRRMTARQYGSSSIGLTASQPPQSKNLRRW